MLLLQLGWFAVFAPIPQHQDGLWRVPWIGEHVSLSPAHPQASSDRPGSRPQPSSRLERIERQRDRFQGGEVELFRGAVDVEADDVAGGVEVGVEAVGDLAGVARRRVFELDIETVRLRVIMELHVTSSRSRGR